MRFIKKILLLVAIASLIIIFTPKELIYKLTNTIEQVEESQKIEATLVRVIDGDTALFKIDGVEEKVRFLSINCPEDTTVEEEYGPEATAFTKKVLTNATKIVLERDPVSSERDSYDRLLFWIWADDELLESLLVENGLATVSYTLGQYKYDQQLYELEQQAKEEKKGVWK